MDPRIESILKRLDKLEAADARIQAVELDQLSLRNEFETLNQNVKDVKTILEQIRAGLIGDTIDPEKPGIIIRLDRLEQSGRLKNKIIWFLLGALISVLPFLFESIR